ncbi:MAG: hypothetical protein LBP63_09230, partial [Prevotellaceae bacterium]|nr:hypothetical protein [Prevotellaceae bacterium]
MKRKIKIILSVILAFYSTLINAQYNNYYVSDKVSGTGFTFMIDKNPDGHSSYYKIYNKNNVKFFMPSFTSIPTLPL